MSALLAGHVHANPGAIRAALARPCPPGVPLGEWLDFLADEHGEPTATPPQPAAPEVMHMADEKTCTKCGKKLRSDNTKGICGAGTACKTRAAGGAVETPAVKPPPPARVKKAPPGVSWLERFRQLHAALGLDADGAIEEHCRSWVEAVTSRALGQATAKPVRLHARQAEQQTDDAVGLGG